MEDSAITWVANNPYCIAAIALVIFGGLIMLAIDCWQKSFKIRGMLKHGESGN